MKTWFCTLLVCVSATTACLDDEAPDPGATTDESVYTDAGAIDEDLAGDMTEVDLPVAPEADTVEKSSLHRLLSTAYNLRILKGCHTNGLLDWSCANHEDGRDAHFAFKREVGSNDTEVADNHDGYWGECVSLVKAAAKNDTVTSAWRPGANVFAGLASGTAIATFPGGHYDGHTAILLSYVKDAGGHVIAIRVGDQNWLGRTVKRHIIRKGGSGVSNANNYAAVLVP